MNSYELKRIRFKPSSLEIISIRETADGTVTIEGAVGIAAFEGGERVGRSETKVTAAVSGSEETLVNLIESLARRLMVLSAGYVVGMNEVLVPLTERMTADIENANGGN
jgi:hypothetical protein